jgi:hypothetical protein
MHMFGLQFSDNAKGHIQHFNGYPLSVVWTLCIVLCAGNHMEEKSYVLTKVSEYVAPMDHRFIGCTI